MRLVVFAHRWLGIFGCLLFITWFASGIVMMYARMPEVTEAERLARQPSASFPSLTVSPSDAASRHDLSPQRVRISRIAGRPVYRMLDRGRWIVIFADTGGRLERLAPEPALREAARFSREPVQALRYDERLTDPDQWTLQSRALLPAHRIRVADAEGTVLYVSEATGDIAVRTTARERRIAYVGAVLHWLYFTPLRRNGPLWNQVIIWTSLAGSVMCLLGLIWGVWAGLRSPYRGWMWWHHTAGLVFGLVSFTWVFSGLLSMDPWDWHPGTAPTRAQRDAFSGGPLRLDAFKTDGLRTLQAREIELTQFRGEPRIIVDDRPGRPIDRDILVTSAREAMPGVAIQDIAALDVYDAYYYDRGGDLPLPVVRVRYADPVQTWLYIDPNRGTILRKEERLTRLNRWLYHGLHSLDFPWLYYRRPLWDVVVILLSLGGISSAVKSIVPAWRRLRRHAQRLYT